MMKHSFLGFSGADILPLLLHPLLDPPRPRHDLLLLRHHHHHRQVNLKSLLQSLHASLVRNFFAADDDCAADDDGDNDDDDDDDDDDCAAAGEASCHSSNACQAQRQGSLLFPKIEFFYKG